MKIIIDNRTDLDWETVFDVVMSVIKNGRISNDGKQYCYLSTFNIDSSSGGSQYAVATDVNKKSDRFVVYKVGEYD